MSQTRAVYEHKIRSLLALLNPATMERGVRVLLQRARHYAQCHGLPESRGLEHVYGRLYARTERILERRGLKDHVGLRRWRDTLDPAAVTFLCDAGLGGLARWLRAAGYPAHWQADVSDDQLLREALRCGAIMLTTDSHLLKRGIVRRGELKALWIPPSLTKQEQLVYVLRELRLPVRETRCMDCGGKLVQVPKESVAEQIPPRTYRWLDTYYRCHQCGKLFWEGTHWRRIEATLAQAAESSRARAP